MVYELDRIAASFKGRFLIPPLELQQKFSKIKAYIFDWDGVFNNGAKDENGFSPFSEVDAMGTNMLRFCHFLRFQQFPLTFIISGEKNKGSAMLAQREHFHAVYSGFKHKRDALEHLCKKHHITPQETVFIFDDLLDFSIANICGIRLMVNRKANPLLVEFATQYKLADYLTEADGASHAVREATELLAGLSGKHNAAYTSRMKYNDLYKQYLGERDKVKTALYTFKPANPQASAL